MWSAPGCASARCRCCTRSACPLTARCRSSAPAARAASWRSTRCAATSTPHGILRLTRAPYGPRALAGAGGALPGPHAGALSLHRHPHHRVLRARRPADRQRDGAAGAQLGPLDHRGRRLPASSRITCAPSSACRSAAPAPSVTAPWSISSATIPQRSALLSFPGLHLHDYGKQPRPGRKVGHCTLVEASAARRDARALKLLKDLAAGVRIP